MVSILPSHAPKPLVTPSAPSSLSFASPPFIMKSQPQLRPIAAEPRVFQPYDYFLVLDVEATCIHGGGFDWPNEIIEWPVCLMRWKDKDRDGYASQLEVVAEFHTYVKPVWRPKLSDFCTELTGITQAQVDNPRTPTFAEVARRFTKFLVSHGLIDPITGARRARFCWVTDTPCDIRDFVVKQCFISKMQMPAWIKGDVLDIRRAVGYYVNASNSDLPQIGRLDQHPMGPRRRSMTIPDQLIALGLPEFKGRLHSGIDDARNIARIVTELARKGIRLEPNTSINPARRWIWMGKLGQVLEQYTITVN